jgi:hypothetical protein
MSGPIRIRCSSGVVVVTGPIRGNDGMLGDGCRHLEEIDLCRGLVRRTLALAKMMALRSEEQPSIFEPSPGHLAVYPNWSHDSDGEFVEVPILGTDFEVL